MNDTPSSTGDPRLSRARDWFETLHARIIAAMEALERAFAGVGGDRPPGRFAIEPWERTDASGAPGGGGRMGVLRGRLFEKMGAHVSLVHGAFPAEFASQIPGADKDPRFWAAGVSVIAHPWSPHVPTVHMNTRLVRTTKTWFGGGADLTPMLDESPQTGRSRRHRLSRRDARGLRAPSGRRRRRAVQDVVRRVFLSQASQRAARNRRDFLRLSQQRGR